MSNKILTIYILFIITTFSTFAQTPNKSEKSAARRFADSMYYIHTIKPQQQELLKEQEMFDSKRPFGNSDWDCDLIICLIKNNVIYGKLDEDDYIEDYDWKHYDIVLKQLIEDL